MKKISRADAQFLGEMRPSQLKGPRYLSHLILFTIILFFVIAFLWAKSAIIDEMVRGVGKVIPSRQVQVVQNLEGGIVKQILVREGMIVQKDQPLLIIDDTRFRSTYKENLVKEDSLQIRLLRLTAEVEKKPFTVPENLAKQQPQTFHFEEALFQARQLELKQLIETYELARQELDMTKPLVNKGAASPVEILRLQRAMSDLKSKVDNFRSDTLDQLNKVQAEFSSLKESSKADIDRLKRTVVRAPIKGVVKQLKIYTEGGVVQPGMDLVEIVPLADTLLVEAKIRPKDIGFVRLNQPATVTITAFDFSIYGTLKGKVEQISADAIADEKEREPYYLIRVRTQKNYLGTPEKPLYIIPGMQAQVAIQTGQRTVLNYILSPIVKTLNIALHER